jgi:hypothetical protein
VAAGSRGARPWTTRFEPLPDVNCGKGSGTTGVLHDLTAADHRARDTVLHSADGQVLGTQISIRDEADHPVERDSDGRSQARKRELR